MGPDHSFVPRPSSSSRRVPIQLPGLRAALGVWDGFILDLWGVIHDGVAAYPHSVETLRTLKQHGSKIIFLSNAPRRARSLVQQMENMGIPEALYDAILSSGEVVRRDLMERTREGFSALGQKCFHLGPDRDTSIYEDTGVSQVPLDQADFIMNTGPVELTDSVEHYLPLLKKAQARRLTMICANPDRVVIREGREIVCAGALADAYHRMGGVVLWCGKPDPEIYNDCLLRLGIPASRVCVIGDSLDTDMVGAAASGISGIWITGGIHAKEVDGGYGKPGDPLRMARLTAAHGVAPTAVLPGFIW